MIEEKIENESPVKSYAENGWTVEDILARFPAATPGTARMFLEKFERKIVDAMIEAGWDVIDDLGDMSMGWEKTTEDEDEAYDRAREQLETC